MNYDREFHFLYTVLQKNHVRALLLNSKDIASGRIDDGSLSPYAIPEPIEIDICALLANAEDKTLYHATDKLERKFTFLTLPGDKERDLLLIGPYLNVQKTQSQILELQESLGIASGKGKHISEYYSSLPLIAAGSPIFSMIDAFCELIWETKSLEDTRSSMTSTWIEQGSLLNSSWTLI